MRTVVFAYHNVGLVGLEALKRHGFDIAAVFSHADDPEEKRWFGSVVDWSRREGIPVFCPETVNTSQWVAYLREIAPDTLFSFYFRYLIHRDILNLAPRGAFNLHGSLLPAYRGRVPVNWVLVNGETVTGVTLHYMVEKADAGDIVGQRAVAIAFTDTALSLYDKLCRAAAELLDELLPLIKAGRAPRIPQDERLATTYGRRRPEDGRIDWHWPAVRIYNLIRAVTEPYPGAFAYLAKPGMGEEKVFVWWAVPEEGEGRQPGTVTLRQGRVYVGTGQGLLELRDIQVGNRRMKGEEIYRFFHDHEGMRWQ
ncbi:MAG: formyltransferase [Syntrophales bacterium]|nr:formyltransferase [Syntrophales bacterium]